MNLKRVEWSLEDYNGLFEKEVPSQLLQNPLFQKDIWLTKEDLGLEIHEHHKVLTLNFSQINQSWLKVLVQLFILTRANVITSPDTLQHEVGHLSRLSKFLEEKYINNPKYIDSQLFEEFDNWIRTIIYRKKKLSERTISLHYTTFNNFFTTCRLEQWLEINTYWFRGKTSKHTKVKNDEINYIPEEIWNQLEEHLHYFPEPMQRKVLIIRTLGLRIGELLNLPFNCLRKRGDQWRLRLKETEKFKIEDEMPVPLDLVPVIKEQQKYISENLEDSYNNLFCSNNGGQDFNFIPIDRIMVVNTFNRWLNKLAKEYNICSKDGEVWYFTSHQFRRTIGTIMTNAGVRDLIIQKYLRHRNPDMQKHYKHLLKEVIGEEYQELTKEKNFVNIEGKVVSTHKPQDVIEEYIEKLWDKDWEYLFCHYHNISQSDPTHPRLKPVKKVIPTNGNPLQIAIRTLIKAENILDDNGELSKFQTRLIRETRLTELFLKGHDLSVVSAWAGHRQLATTANFYTQVTCEQIEKEVGHIQSALVNADGKKIYYESMPKSFWDNPVAHELEVAGTHVNTPIYGYCGLDLDEECDKFRACYTCRFFVAKPEKLSQYVNLRDELRGKQERALANGHGVLVEQFARQADQLDKIIASLQEAA